MILGGLEHIVETERHLALVLLFDSMIGEREQPNVRIEGEILACAIIEQV